MMIRLNPDWRLRTDELNWIVERRTGKRKARRGGGKIEGWKAEAYFCQLANVFGFLTRKRIWAIDGEFGAEALDLLSQAMTDIATDIAANIELFRRIDKVLASGAKLPLGADEYLDTGKLPDDARRGLARRERLICERK